MAFILSQALALFVIKLVLIVCVIAFWVYKSLPRRAVFDAAIVFVLFAIIMFTRVNW
ncbi:MAG: hypothetical protein FWE31_00490 [Firmicutes bacterium]|nr:hypothetical protein [Bacillota bacterium]